MSSGLLGSFLDLLAEVTHVDVDRAARGSRAPAQALEELPAREDDPRARSEQCEHLELDERQLHRLASDLDDPAWKVDPRLTLLDDFQPLPSRRRARRAAQQRTYTAAELRIENGFVM